MLCQGAYCRRREKSLWAGPTQKKKKKKKQKDLAGVVLVPPIPRLYNGVQPRSTSERIAQSVFRSQVLSTRVCRESSFPPHKRIKDKTRDQYRVGTVTGLYQISPYWTRYQSHLFEFNDVGTSKQTQIQTIIIHEPCNAQTVAVYFRIILKKACQYDIVSHAC